MVIKISRLLLTAALLGFIAPAFAQEQFGTPEAAVEALVTAARSEDGAAILKVLGPDGKPIVSSGDPVADSNIRQNFVTAYDAKHIIEMEGDGTRTLVIDNDDWPFPIPLVNKAGQWQFDTKAGRDEILRRRIGGVYGRELATGIGKVLAASLAMAGVTAFSSHEMENWLGVSQWARLGDLALSIPLGLAVFYGMCRMLGVHEIDLAIRAFAAPVRRRLKRAGT